MLVVAAADVGQVVLLQRHLRMLSAVVVGLLHAKQSSSGALLVDEAECYGAIGLLFSARLQQIGAVLLHVSV